MLSRTTRLTLTLLVIGLWSVPANAGTRSVTVGNDFFSPKTVTLDSGDKVTWIWKSRGRKHNVASSSFGDSGVRRRGSFTVRFTQAGRLRYFCFLHDGMTGTVVVRR